MGWEKEYKKFDKQKVDERIQELEQKYNDKTIEKGEARELKTIKAIRANIDKVTNIVEFSETLNRYRHKINRELQRREALEKVTLETKTQYEEDNELILKLKAKLKEKGLSDEVKGKITNKINELNQKIQKNNDKYVKIKKMEKSYQENDGKDFIGKSNEELINDKLQISENISVCRFVCANLMKGMDWDITEFKVLNNKKYTSQQKLTEKFGKEETENQTEQENEVAKLEQNENNEIIVEGPETLDINSDKQVKQRAAETFSEITRNIKENEEETSLIETKVSSFKEKHPKLAKFFNGIKEKISSMFNRKQETVNEEQQLEELAQDMEEPINDIEDVVIENEQIEEKSEIKVEEVVESKEQENNEDFMSRRKEFVDFLKEVADRGISIVNEEKLKEQEEIDKEQAELRIQQEEAIRQSELRHAQAKEKARKMEIAKEKFKEEKNKRIDEEAIKYGDKYANRSKDLKIKATKEIKETHKKPQNDGNIAEMPNGEYIEELAEAREEYFEER